MEYLQTDLSKFSTGNYSAGSKIKVVCWYFINYFIFNSSLPWPYLIKVYILRYFGAHIGSGLVIKAKVRIKNPWLLSIGDNCWIGESVWIDNLVQVNIGNHVCISQGATLLTGNHDYTKRDFPYRLGKIDIEDGVWIGAQSVVCPGTRCRSHSILTVNSVAVTELEPWSVYAGNPAVLKRERKITS